MPNDVIKVWRCKAGHCGRLVSREMFTPTAGCPFCGFNEFTNPGKIRFFESLFLRIRHFLAEQRQKAGGDKN